MHGGRKHKKEGERTQHLRERVQWRKMSLPSRRSPAHVKQLGKLRRPNRGRSKADLTERAIAGGKHAAASVVGSAKHWMDEKDGAENPENSR